MCRLWIAAIVLGAVLTITAAEIMLRIIEGDRERKRHDEMTRVEYEAEETAATAWENN